MSATLPVSFQYPEIIVDRTLWPVSISHCRASVISEFPAVRRAELAHRLVYGGVKIRDTAKS